MLQLFLEGKLIHKIPDVAVFDASGIVKDRVGLHFGARQVQVCCEFEREKRVAEIQFLFDGAVGCFGFGIVKSIGAKFAKEIEKSVEVELVDREGKNDQRRIGKQGFIRITQVVLQFPAFAKAVFPI